MKEYKFWRGQVSLYAHMKGADLLTVKYAAEAYYIALTAGIWYDLPSFAQEIKTIYSAANRQTAAVIESLERN